MECIFNQIPNYYGDTQMAVCRCVCLSVHNATSVIH